MRLGIVIEETWDFLHEVYADLAAHHDTRIFKRREKDLPILTERINRAWLHSDLERFLRQNDAVFFEWSSELLALATQLPKTCGISTRLHRYEMYQWAESVNWQAVDRIILVSRAKEREFNERFPGHAHKIVVIPEAISLERFQLRPKPFNGDIGILCHLRPRKRVYELILAFYELIKTQPGLHLHIGGGSPGNFGEYGRALHALVRDLELDDRVTFYGPVDKPEDWYPLVDIFISNSYSEGLQVAPMEAIATGRYCLAHAWEGASELLPPEDLFYSERELIGLIKYYIELSDADQAARRAKQRARVLEHFDVDKTKAQIRQVIESTFGRTMPQARTMAMRRVDQ